MRRSECFYLTPDEFLKILKHFKEGVNKGWYEKISYPIWKEMLRVCEKLGSFNIFFHYSIDKYKMPDLDNCDISITFISHESGEYDRDWTFTSDDLSFGMFLAEEYGSMIEESIKYDNLQGTSSLPIYDSPRLNLKYYDTNTGLGYCNMGECELSKDSIGELSNAIKSNISNLKADCCSSDSVTVCNNYATSNQLDNLTTSFLNLKLDSEKVGESIKEISKRLEETRYELHLETEENKVMMKGFNFEFGPLNGGLAKMSIYGLAVRNKSGVYVSYNAETQELMDVEIFQFDGSKFLYRMPVAVKDIVVGDVVIHQNIPMFVVDVPVDGKTLKVVDPCNGERKEIMLTRSPFGFNFATKIVNFLDGMTKGVTPSADNPFGNMWMLALMDGDKDMSKMLPFMFMNQSGMNIDPMMMMLMMGDNKDMGDMLPLMMMMNMNKPAAPHTCNGNCHCHEGHSSDC